MPKKFMKHAAPVDVYKRQAVLRAAEINADVIMLAKNVDGVYDSDPVQNPDAKKYDQISYDDVLAQHLSVMDSTATSLSMDNKIPVLLFALEDPQNIILSLIHILLDSAKEPALRQLRGSLALEAIIKAENIEATEEEVDAEMQKMADQYGLSLEDVKKYLRSADVEEQIKREKALKLVVDSASVKAAE